MFSFRRARLLSGGALALVALWVGAASARADDAADVKATIAAFHAALASLDIAQMEPLWAQDDTVMDKEPIAKATTLGWAGTRKNFEGLFGAATKLTTNQTEGPNVQVKGDVAYSTGINDSAGTFKGGPPFSAPVYEADVFEKRDGKWVYVSHAAFAMPK